MAGLARASFVLSVLVVASCGVVLCNAASKKIVMPWMGLERTGEDISSDLAQIAANLDVVNHAAFECYNLGEDGTLVKNNLTVVNPTLEKWGIQTFPMVSTYMDAPPHRRNDTVEWARKLFANPTPFIEAAVRECLENGYAGINLDIEPDGSLVSDAYLYADFLNTFSDAMHKVGKLVTVDIAHWAPMLAYNVLNTSRLDKVFSMDGYIGSNDLWLQYFNAAVEAFGVDRLGMGLITVNPNTNKPFTVEDMQFRFDAIQQAGVREIDIWDAPIPDDWFPIIRNWLALP
eukprot:ANDGO_07473.mRNA.1 hypothetical protein CAOG_05148